MFIVHDDHALDDKLAIATRDLILSIEDKHWFEYNNPFESKIAMGFKECIGNAYYVTQYVMTGLEGWLRAKSGIDLRHDPTGAFTSIFRYSHGDYLQPHLDAGLHPYSSARKRMTVLLYLSTDDLKGGTLNFYSGNSSPDKLVYQVQPKFNTLIAFENTDHAWHGCQVVTKGTKIVVTASYLTDDDSGFSNYRKKAYFAPAPGATWPDEMLELRDKRADPKSAPEIYVQR